MKSEARAWPLQSLPHQTRYVPCVSFVSWNHHRIKIYCIAVVCVKCFSSTFFIFLKEYFISNDRHRQPSSTWSSKSQNTIFYKTCIFMWISYCKKGNILLKDSIFFYLFTDICSPRAVLSSPKKKTLSGRLNVAHSQCNLNAKGNILICNYFLIIFLICRIRILSFTNHIQQPRFSP